MAKPGTFAAQSGQAQSGNTNAPNNGGGSFPQNVSPAQFQVSNQVSNTDMAIFQNNPTNMAAMQQYTDMTQADRQQMQQQLVAAGLLSPSYATGFNNPTARSAYVQALANAARSGQELGGYLGQLSQGNLGPLENEVSANLTSAQRAVSSAAPVTATLENPTTLTADITNAFDQALGYAPDQAQIQAFINQVQGQDVSYAEGTNQQNRATAQAAATQAQSEQSALKGLGENGVDAFLNAYHSVVNGLPGGAGPQGPQVGTVGQYPQLAQNLPGTHVVTPAQLEKETKGKMIAGRPMEVMTARNAQGQAEETVNPAAESAAAAVPVHGGEYALSPALWDQGLKLLGQQGKDWQKKYQTAGSAPVNVQQSVATALASSLYAKTGDWTQVATTMAQGSPVAGKNVSGFATGVAIQVSNQIANLQNEINTTPSVVTKVTAPDATAEAGQAAKTADPVGYEAANIASAGDLLSRMIQGAPQLAAYSSTDTFSGPAPLPSPVAANGTGA